MCHPIGLTHIGIEITVEPEGVRIVATTATMAPTGVEMEALTAAAVAALTIYDMTKALDKGIEIQDLFLLEKTGGKSETTGVGHDRRMRSTLKALGLLLGYGLCVSAQTAPATGYHCSR